MEFFLALLLSVLAKNGFYITHCECSKSKINAYKAHKKLITFQCGINSNWKNIGKVEII
jgi:hypothetical protein